MSRSPLFDQTNQMRDKPDYKRSYGVHDVSMKGESEKNGFQWRFRWISSF